MERLPDAIDALVDLVRQEPARHGCLQSCWRSSDLAQAIPALCAYTRSGICRLLHRQGIHLKRGRLKLHSPDPAYDTKVAAITAALGEARTHPTTHVLLYADEASCYRQPVLGQRWHPSGKEPTALMSHTSNTRHRICAGVNAVTGDVHWTAGSKVTVAQLCRWLRLIEKTYRHQTVTIVWDNWPVHAHPKVLAEAERLHLHILWLPTYAPWLNPIEKCWRWMKQTVLVHHPFADRWGDLVAAIHDFLNRFKNPSPDLLRYIGLLRE